LALAVSHLLATIRYLHLPAQRPKNNQYSFFYFAEYLIHITLLTNFK
jgi:hypothetical protein